MDRLGLFSSIFRDGVVIVEKCLSFLFKLVYNTKGEVGIVQYDTKGA